MGEPGTEAVLPHPKNESAMALATGTAARESEAIPNVRHPMTQDYAKLPEWRGAKERRSRKLSTMRLVRRLASLSLAGTAIFAVETAHAEPTDPVLIGWWSYFDNSQIDTTSSPQHQVTHFGDPNTYYYEPSGGHGLQEDPNALPKAQAWQNIVSYILAKSNGASLSSSFSINTSSDLNALTQAYYGWALALLYVPKDKYCDDYRIHIGSVDDGVQAMANATILGYANLGDHDALIPMVEYNSNPPKLVLRPGINEIVLIHEDQAAVERYVKDVWVEHNGQQVPLAPKNTAWGRVVDQASQAPINAAKVGLSGPSSDNFVTGPFGFYFFSGLSDGAEGITADQAGYKTATANVNVALGQGTTEVVRTDLALATGCECPAGQACGPSGGCLDPCVLKGELGEGCQDPEATCVNHVCVKDPCDTLTCAMGFTCVTTMQGMPPKNAATCVEAACSNVCCGPSEVCSGGLCVPNNCGNGCPAGQTCAGGNCVNGCDVVTCADNLVCKGGECMYKCDADPASCQSDAGIDLGTGGASASSSAATGGGGSGGSGIATIPKLDDSTSSAGCGCRTQKGREPGSVAAIVGAVLALSSLRRRHRERS